MPIPQCRRRSRSFLIGVLVSLFVAGAAAQLGRANTWSATSTSGLTLMGTWTAEPDPVSGAVAGTWTLIDARGTTLARGGWSATKARSGWSGAWRSVGAGGTTEYSGTWTSGIALGAEAPFADLFQDALKNIVSGAWKAGRYSGAWSIRAYR